MYNEVKKARLKELKINNKGMNDSVTLSAVYTIERKNGSIDELIIPEILLINNVCILPDVEIESKFGESNAFVDFGFGRIPILPNENNEVFKCVQIKPADAKELTLAEIEEKLGYPVKIVKER